MVSVPPGVCVGCCCPPLKRALGAAFPVAADAPCQGFSVSDGTAGWQTGEQHVALRRSSGQQPEEEEAVDGRAPSLQSVCALSSAGVSGYVTDVLS